MHYQVIPRHTQDARVEEISNEPDHYLLSIPVREAGKYRLAQLDDYAHLKRKNFPLHPSSSLLLSARTSSESIPGTWGFGFWNDPFGLALGFGGNPTRFPTLPNAAWFFGASQESYLSFRNPRAARSERFSASEDDTAPVGRNRDAQISPETYASSTGFAEYAQPFAQREVAANGFIAQAFRSPKFDLRMIPAGLAFPFSRRTTRGLLGKVIDEDGINLGRDGRLPIPTEVTDWHRYRIDWRENRVSFTVDDELVLETSVSPHPPLGLVIWIDNQYAAFTPEGKIGFGVLANPEPTWLEIKEIEIR